MLVAMSIARPTTAIITTRCIVTDMSAKQLQRNSDTRRRTKEGGREQQEDEEACHTREQVRIGKAVVGLDGRGWQCMTSLHCFLCHFHDVKQRMGSRVLANQYLPRHHINRPL
jgi:hypothetical protein